MPGLSIPGRRRESSASYHAAPPAAPVSATAPTETASPVHIFSTTPPSPRTLPAYEHHDDHDHGHEPTSSGSSIDASVGTPACMSPKSPMYQSSNDGFLDAPPAITLGPAVPPLPTSSGVSGIPPSSDHHDTHSATPSPVGSKTSSFFATSQCDTPPPAPKLAPAAPSPLSLSRASSLRARALPNLPSPTQEYDHVETAAELSQLAPLHQSPSLAPTWTPPKPPHSDHIEMRLYPDADHLLGEGRYARVYLAAYRHRDDEWETKWRLCAAKRLAADRESQTMGLREAFFLNRLNGPTMGRKGSLARRSERGRVFIVKLIAVKEEQEAPSPANAAAVLPPSPTPGRKRSSTIYAGGREGPEHTMGHSHTPSLPGALELDKQPPPSPRRLVLLLEHIPLGSIDRMLRTEPGVVGERLWGRWAREAAEALDWVHSRGVVHADIKPSNILLTADLHLRLTDFGSSLLIHPSSPPTDGVGLGTLPFSAPELVDPNATFSFPIDIFALGASLYQMITGREPYRGSRPIEMMHHVRNGILWDWEERQRLKRIGEHSASSSPYPSGHSSWRADPVPAVEVRRAISLKVPPGQSPSPHKRFPSADHTPLFGTGADAMSSEGLSSPGGIRSWAAWANGARHDAVDKLLDDDGKPTLSPLRPRRGGNDIARKASIRSARSVLSSMSSPESSPESIARRRRISTERPSSSAALRAITDLAIDGGESPRRQNSYDDRAYADGAPAMHFLGGGRVPDDVRDVLRAMLDPVASERPSVGDVLAAWDQLKVGV